MEVTEINSWSHDQYVDASQTKWSSRLAYPTKMSLLNHNSSETLALGRWHRITVVSSLIQSECAEQACAQPDLEKLIS
jgi:hypothetical protein